MDWLETLQVWTITTSLSIATLAILHAVSRPPTYETVDTPDRPVYYLCYEAYRQRLWPRRPPC